jgi:hypothetical protein
MYPALYRGPHGKMSDEAVSDPHGGREGRRVESFEVNAFDDPAFFFWYSPHLLTTF